MSVERFLVVLKTARIHEDDRVWFGRWLRRYAVFLHQPETASLTLSPDSVKQFCHTLLARQSLEKGSGTNSQMARRVLRTIGS